MKRRTSFIAIVMLLALLAGTGTAFAAEGTSSGTAHVTSAIPTISDVALTTIAPSQTNKNGSNGPINVATEYWTWFNVSTSSTMSDIINCTAHLWNAADGTENGSDSQRFHYSYIWTNDTDAWAADGTTGASYIVSGNCTDPTDKGVTKGSFRLAFKLSKVAANGTESLTYDDWRITINVVSNGGSGVDRTLAFQVNYYTELTITDTTHEWSALVPPVVNQTMDSSPLDGTYLSNGNCYIQAKGNDTSLHGPGTNTITIGHILIHKDTLADAANLTTGYVTVGGLTALTAPADEASPTAWSLILWINIESGTPPGDYAYVLDLQNTG